MAKKKNEVVELRHPWKAKTTRVLPASAKTEIAALEEQGWTRPAGGAGAGKQASGEK